MNPLATCTWKCCIKYTDLRPHTGKAKGKKGVLQILPVNGQIKARLRLGAEANPAVRNLAPGSRFKGVGLGVWDSGFLYLLTDRGGKAALETFMVRTLESLA
jgi:hypothetical protein